MVGGQGAKRSTVLHWAAQIRRLHPAQAGPRRCSHHLALCLLEALSPELIAELTDPIWLQ